MLLQHNDDDRIMSDINIVPLVDIMLVLLITFMMVSTMVDFSAIHVELPQAATAEDATDKSFSIVISKDGDYFISGEPVSSIDDLKLRIEHQKIQNPQIQAVISADKSVTHGQVIKVLDLIRRLKIAKYAISVELSEDGIE
jgi:biopolymer transport protein ExbD